jgi:hypothetical protein
MFGLEKTHHQALRRAAEQTVDQIANSMIDYLAAADRRLVEVGPVLERAFNLALAVQNIEHRLHGRVSQLTLQSLLHGLDVGRTGLPEHADNLQLRRGQ